MSDHHEHCFSQLILFFLDVPNEDFEHSRDFIKKKLPESKYIIEHYS